MEDLKKIIAVFVKKDADQIVDTTLINNKAMSGSIMIHRMYAAINNAGFHIKDSHDINTYGELVSRLNLGGDNSLAIKSVNINWADMDVIDTTTGVSVGIDIEAIDNLPLTNEFREEQFYADNFTASEISYAILKTNPYETFAGIFAAKEALCKANNSIRKIPFNQINITHDDAGKPYFKNYAISISHSNNVAVAVAVLIHNKVSDTPTIVVSNNVPENTAGNTGAPVASANFIAKLSLVISILVAIAVIWLFLVR